MRSIFTILLVFTIVNVFAQERAGKVGGKSLSPKILQIKYPADSTYDVTYYKLDIFLDHVFFTTNRIVGSVLMKAKANAENLTNIYIDLKSNMNLDSITSSLGAVNYNRVGDKTYITFPSTLNLGEEFDVTVFYNGVPGSSGLGSFEYSTHNGNPIIWSLSEPYGSPDWWPCKDTPADKPDSVDIWITANSYFTSVSNGKLVEVVENGNNTKTYKWAVRYPIAQYLISVAMSNYMQYDTEYTALDGSTMPVTHFIYPEKWNTTRKAQLDATTDMIHEFALMFGEYPFLKEKYGHAEFGWGGGMEHQTVSSMVGFNRDLVSHELAHQWFGDMITCKDWHHIWVNEGFATYLEALYVEKKSGFAAYSNKIAEELTNAKYAYGSVYCVNIDDDGEIFSGARSYSKGAAILHMLRGVLGDSIFFKTMYDFANDPQLKYGVATTEDFQHVAETVSGKDLDYFFSEWVYGENYPTYDVNWGYNNFGLTGNKYNAHVKVSQRNNSTPAFFTMPVQFKFHTSVGDTLITVFNDQKIQEFNFVLNGEPTTFKFDPNVWILRTIGTSATDVEAEPINLLNYNLEQNYPNPFNPETKISYKIGSSEQVKLTVYDVLGREITTLVNEFQNAGNYSYNFDASNLAGGVYIYQLSTPSYQNSKKLILLQ